MHSGRVWLVTARLEARPLDEHPSVILPPAPATPDEAEVLASPRTPSAASAPTIDAHGAITEHRDTRVLVSFGADVGLARGSLVEMSPPEGDVTRTAVVGRVVDVRETSAELEIGFGEVVRVGDVAATTARGATRVLEAPAHLRSMIVVAGALRLFVPIDALGAGGLGDLSLTWHADIPFSLRARVAPVHGIGISVSRDGRQEAWGLYGAAMLEAAFDSQYFAIGLGLGVAQARAPTFFGDGGRPPGFAIQPVVRGGAIDGFHVEARPLILVVDDAFEFGGFEGEFQIAVHPGAWIRARGAGWIAGSGFADLGVRFALEGNGGDGTVLLTPTIGWSGIDVRGRGFLSGPSVGVSLEVRVGL